MHAKKISSPMPMIDDTKEEDPNTEIESVYIQKLFDEFKKKYQQICK